MKLQKRFAIQLSIAAGLILSTVPNTAFGQDAAATAPDNTKMNKPAKNGALTADSQKMDKADRDLTKNIRHAVIADKTLSTYAHNVKIISRDGMVTLKGPVRSDEEKAAVEKAATGVAGEGKVTNQLMVAPGKSKK